MIYIPGGLVGTFGFVMVGLVEVVEVDDSPLSAEAWLLNAVLLAALGLAAGDWSGSPADRGIWCCSNGACGFSWLLDLATGLADLPRSWCICIGRTDTPYLLIEGVCLVDGGGVEALFTGAECTVCLFWVVVLCGRVWPSCLSPCCVYFLSTVSLPVTWLLEWCLLV